MNLLVPGEEPPDPTDPGNVNDQIISAKNTLENIGSEIDSMIKLL